MTAMARRALIRRCCSRLVAGLVLGVLAGLLWMHALTVRHHGFMAPPGSHPAAASDAHHGMAGTNVCGHHDGVPHGPASPLGHPTQVCQSGAVAAGFAPTVPDACAWSGPPPVAVPARSSPAAEAGAGTGCGPPSLTMLSISRT
jgi:hypothetical protein